MSIASIISIVALVLSLIALIVSAASFGAKAELKEKIDRISNPSQARPERNNWEEIHNLNLMQKLILSYLNVELKKPEKEPPLKLVKKQKKNEKRS